MRSKSFRHIFSVLAFTLACISLAGCTDNGVSDAGTSSIAESTIAEETETPITVTSTEATTTSTAAITTTTEESTTTAPVTTQALLLDTIAGKLDTTAELTSPFGDISTAYMCIGSIEVYPSVYVLSAEEAEKFSRVFNSMEWTEFEEKPERPTTGANGIVLYINDHGKRWQLSLLSDTYMDETTTRYFRITQPTSIEEHFSLMDIAYDLELNGASEQVSTHLSQQSELFHSEEDYDINRYWDLIWDDVNAFIEKQEEQNG